MAKRLIDTGFLRQKWIRKLPPERKIFLIYLMLECDNGGIIELDFEDVTFWIGKKIDDLDWLPEGYLIPIEGTEKYFQPKFIEWQYKNFPHSKVHQQMQAKEILSKYGLFNTETQTLILPKTYPTFTQPLPESQVIGNGNDSAIENDIENENIFNEFWEKYHSVTGKPKTDKDATIKHFNKLTKKEKEKAIEMIEPYSKTQDDSQYLKKARTYLSEKNFNDEMNIVKTVRNHPQNKPGVNRILNENYNDPKFRKGKPESITDILKSNNNTSNHDKIN